MPHWNRLLQPIKNLGGRLIGVTADTPANVREFKKLRQIDFECISDPSCELATYYNVLSLRDDVGLWSQG